jgi:hypothetical protein
MMGFKWRYLRRRATADAKILHGRGKVSSIIPGNGASSMAHKALPATID